MTIVKFIQFFDIGKKVKKKKKEKLRKFKVYFSSAKYQQKCYKRSKILRLGQKNQQRVTEAFGIRTSR